MARLPTSMEHLLRLVGRHGGPDQGQGKVKNGLRGAPDR